MKGWSWLSDTIARRFAVTVVLAVAVTLALVGLFRTFGGVWSNEPLERSSLLNEAADIVRMIEAAPPSMRRAIAAAAAPGEFRTDWYPAGSSASASLEAAPRGEDENAQETISAHLQRAVAVLRPDSARSLPPGIVYDQSEPLAPYMLAVQLNDGSWLVFTVMKRTWGMPWADRWVIWLCFLAVSITIVTAIAARRFSRPIEQLALAVRQFGLNPRAPPIAESGPRELRQVIKTFNAMQAQIQKFVAYRTTMLAAISHDLRTPLTRMRLRGEFIEDQEQQARLFRDVDEMQNMVDEALAFFRDDATAEETTSFDLPHVLLTIANDYADQGVDIGYAGPAHAVYRGRPFALKRAFTNVIDNAAKYGNSPDIELTCAEAALVVAIGDRGPGIPPDAIENVFLPYYRVDKSRNRTTGGVGLGLTVAQAIVHGHGGEISLRNRAEGGLEVRIVLPQGTARPSWSSDGLSPSPSSDGLRPSLSSDGLRPSPFSSSGNVVSGTFPPCT
jgi:signal transduction histidine kinase